MKSEVKREQPNDEKVQPQVQSPLNVEGVDLGISTDEILAFIEEGRRVPLG